MAKPSEILTKKKAKDDDKKSDDKAPVKGNALLDFIAKHKKPAK